MPGGGWVTATWARQCPADAFDPDPVARVGVEPTGHQGLSLAAMPVRVPCRPTPSAPEGIRTPDLLADNEASTPGCSAKACLSLHQWPRRESNPQTPASEAGGFAGLPTGPSSSHIAAPSTGRSRPGGRRGSRTLKAHRSPDFESGAVADRLALPFVQHRGQESNLRTPL